MKINVDTTLLEAARQIAPVIRAHNDEAERERRLSKPVLAALTEAGLMRMLTPRSLGGWKWTRSPAHASSKRLRQPIARPVGACSTPCPGRLSAPDCLMRARKSSLGRDPHAVIAGPFHPPIQATQVDGGYRVTGRSPFASNCRDATWIASTAMVMDGGQPRVSAGGAAEVVVAYFPADDCKIIDTWYLMGMRGTGGEDIAVTDIFVPDRLTFPLVPERDHGSYYQSPLYRFSLMGALAATFPPIVLAIARNAIDEVSTLAQGKTPFGSTTLPRERATAQVKLAQAEAAQRSARALLYDTLGEAWERTLTGELASLKQRATCCSRR